MADQRYVTERWVSEVTGLSLSTLRNHRYLRKGIPFIKYEGGAVRYDKHDVYDFMYSHKGLPAA